LTMPSRMSKAARRRMSEVGGDKEAVRLRLEQMSRGGGKWGPAMKAEYGALMRELRRMEGLTDGLRLEREEFDEYLRKRREEDAKWRGTGTCERKDEGRGGVKSRVVVVLTEEQAKLMDEARVMRERLRAAGLA